MSFQLLHGRVYIGRVFKASLAIASYDPQRHESDQKVWNHIVKCKLLLVCMIIGNDMGLSCMWEGRWIACGLNLDQTRTPFLAYISIGNLMAPKHLHSASDVVWRFEWSGHACNQYSLPLDWTPKTMQSVLSFYFCKHPDRKWALSYYMYMYIYTLATSHQSSSFY